MDAFGNLSKQCSDVDAIGKLIDVIGDVFYSKNVLLFVTFLINCFIGNILVIMYFVLVHVPSWMFWNVCFATFYLFFGS